MPVDSTIKAAVPGQAKASDTGVVGDTSFPVSDDKGRGDLDNDNAVLEDAALDSNGEAVNEDADADADDKKDEVTEDLDSNGEKAVTEDLDSNGEAVVSEDTEADDEKSIEKEFEEAWSKKTAKKKKTLKSSYTEDDQPPVADVAEPEDVEAQKDLPLGEELSKIFTGQNLTESFQSKAQTLFESALHQRVEKQAAVAKQIAKEQIQKRSAMIKESLERKVDKYLSYVVKEWASENKLAIDTGLKTEIAEDFMTGLKALFEEHNINVPAAEESLLEEVSKEKVALESKVEKLVGKVESLAEQVTAYQKKEVLSAVSEGLADTQKEKLQKLSESIEFKDAKQYQSQITHIKEHYFPAKKAVVNNEDDGVAEQTNVKSVPQHIAEAAKHISRNAAR